ncbi:MAG: sulfatase-like hydrolase/transferase [Clostridium sp.]
MSCKKCDKKILKKEIQKLIENNKLNEARLKLDEYKNINPCDMDNYCMKSIIEFLNGDLIKAESILENIYDKYEYNFDINYNLGIISTYRMKYKKALMFLLKALILNPEKEDEIYNIILNQINSNITDKQFNEIKEEVRLYFNNINKVFPKKNNDELYIGKSIKNKNISHYCGIYDYYFCERDGLLLDYNTDMRNIFKTEILVGEQEKEVEFTCCNNLIMPIMKLDKCSKINISINGQEFNLNNNLDNRFYYYPLEKGDSVSITSDFEFVLGKFIELDCDKEKPKLILNIFIDGLSQKFLERNNLKDCMKNTYNFFKEGTMCNNAYVSGEWTYVSMASFFTGLYTTSHRVFNPNHDSNNIFKNKLYSEYLNENGYFCSKIDGDWRSTPSSGYIKGIDRYLYQASVRGMHCDEIINETIEHIESFKEKNNFIWMCIPDLHDVADEFETRLSTQVKNPISIRTLEKTNETSVRKTYDISKIKRYKTQIQRIDTYLGLLFNYINDKFKDDEIVISLFADHGQGYLVESDEFLDEERIKVPMLFRGKNIPKGNCDELIQGLDLFPIIFKSIGLNEYEIGDGNVPKYFDGKSEREYVISESIFPKSPYRFSINDKEHKFFFSTMNECTTDGRINIDDYKIKLINKFTGKEEMEEYKEKVEKYIEIVKEHVKEYVITDI